MTQSEWYRAPKHLDTSSREGDTKVGNGAPVSGLQHVWCAVTDMYMLVTPEDQRKTIVNIELCFTT